MISSRHFCTLFDSGYLFKGVAMLRSLARHCPQAQVWVLCMDAQAFELLGRLQLPGVHRIALDTLETPELRAAKASRGVAEYCWTLSPWLPWHVLQHNPQVDAITYLDADTFFFSDPAPIYAEIGDAPVAIMEHRFIPRLQDQLVKGRFCVEWVTFRRNAEGLRCLDRWRLQCLEWCYYRLEGDRYGDQKYLDAWPALVPGLCIIGHPGAGLAPFNYANYRHGVGPDGVPTVDGLPVIFYHFHQFQLLSNGSVDRLSAFYTVEMPEPDAVYSAYEAALREVVGEVTRVAPGFRAGFKPVHRVVLRRWAQLFMPRPIRHIFHRLFGY